MYRKIIYLECMKYKEHYEVPYRMHVQMDTQKILKGCVVNTCFDYITVKCSLFNTQYSNKVKTFDFR